MTATVRAGEKGVDFSFARPPAARLLELGYTFVVGYISVPPSAPAKNITKAQCGDYIAAGLKVLLVWEMTANRASLGASYGIIDGQWAKAEAFARGYPADVPILVADDTNTVATNVVAQEAYMRAFAAECAPYPIGIYGDTDILAACAGLWRIGWLPNAWSWSGASRAIAEAKARALGAHVMQRQGFYIDNTWAVDPNTAISDFQAWGTPDPAPIATRGDNVTILTNRLAGKYNPTPLSSYWVLMPEGAKRAIPTIEELAAWGTTERVPCDDATLDAIPNYVKPAPAPVPGAVVVTSTVTSTVKPA